MTYEINETHNPDLKSWIESANDPDTDFPSKISLYNLLEQR